MNRKALATILLLVLVSCMLLSYGIAYKNYFTEDLTDFGSGYVTKDYDFQFYSKLINAAPLTDEVTGEQITPSYFTDNYEKNGADAEFIDEILAVPGVAKVLPYRENQKMDILMNMEELDTYFDGTDGYVDGKYRNDDFELVRNRFQYGKEDVLVKSELVGYSAESLKLLEDSVVEGRIDLEKLLSGEEVILRVPSYKLKEMDFGGATMVGILPADEQDPEAIKMSQCRVGDEITLSGLLTDAPLNGGLRESDLDQLYRKDIKVKIGAIIRTNDGTLLSSRIGAGCSILTLNEAFEILGVPARYSVISIYTDIDADTGRIAEKLENMGLKYPNMSFDNWSMDVQTYKIYNLLVSIFAFTLMTILTVVTFALLMIQFYIKTRLNLPSYTLYRINGLGFGKLLGVILVQIVLLFVIGAAISAPFTWLIIKESLHITLSFTNYFSVKEYLMVVFGVFVLMLLSFTPSIGILFRRKDTILRD